MPLPAPTPPVPSLTAAIEGDAVVFWFALPTEHETRIRFEVKAPRQEHTGVHGMLFIKANDVTLKHSYVNLDRDEDRLRLANAAHRVWKPEDAVAFPKERLAHALDKFALLVWPTWIARYAPEEMTAGERTATGYTLTPYVVDGGGTMVYAPPGRGKSTIALLMAQSVNAGVSRLWPVKPRKVCFVNLERSAVSVRQRLGNINEALGLDRREPLWALNARGRSLLNVMDALRKAVADNGIECLVLDSISRAGLGKLVADETGTAFVDMMNDLCETWVAIAHTPRASDDHQFGSVMFDAGADVQVQLSSEQKEKVLGVALDVTKANDTPKPERQTWALEYDAEGRGLVGVRPARAFEFPELAAKRRVSLAEEIREYLLSLTNGRAAAGEIVEALDRSRSKVMAALQGPPFVHAGRNGREVLYGVKAQGADA